MSIFPMHTSMIFLYLLTMQLKLNIMVFFKFSDFVKIYIIVRLKIELNYQVELNQQVNQFN